MRRLPARRTVLPGAKLPVVTSVMPARFSRSTKVQGAALLLASFFSSPTAWARSSNSGGEPSRTYTGPVDS